MVKCFLFLFYKGCITIKGTFLPKGVHKLQELLLKQGHLFSHDKQVTVLTISVISLSLSHASLLQLMDIAFVSMALHD